ncbi:MAG: hypothetical protein L0216_01280 [Planctomycetales bacterium]|nr:hypothetical protein [Planctomycetales bacterium]
MPGLALLLLEAPGGGRLLEDGPSAGGAAPLSVGEVPSRDSLVARDRHAGVQQHQASKAEATEEAEEPREERPFQGRYWNDALAVQRIEADGGVSVVENLRLARGEDPMAQVRAIDILFLEFQAGLSREPTRIRQALEERLLPELLALRESEPSVHRRKAFLRALSRVPKPEVLKALGDVVRSSDESVERKVAIESLGLSGRLDFEDWYLTRPRFTSVRQATAALADARRSALRELGELAKVPRSDREAELIRQYVELLQKRLGS